MKESRSATRAVLVSAILAGSWRLTPTPPLEISEADLDEVTPLLYGSGGAALGWWRVRQTPLNTTASAEVLRQAYRLQALQSAIHEQKIETVFRVLRESSVETILVKGWAAAGLYPDRALRPYGDIDLYVRPADYKTAASLMASPEAAGCWVDLHDALPELIDRSADQLFERSRTVALGAERVRILSEEDHLALLAIHLLKHGAWRPLWLCDIGAAIESRSADFDWDLCLGRNKNRSGWIASAIGLAQLLLGARSSNLPASITSRQLPDWLVHGTLKLWESPFATNQPPMSHPVPMAHYLRHPKSLGKALRLRWPNPLIATISVNGQINHAPRLPYQLGNCLSRLGQFLAALPRELRH